MSLEGVHPGLIRTPQCKGSGFFFLGQGFHSPDQLMIQNSVGDPAICPFPIEKKEEGEKMGYDL